MKKQLLKKLIVIILIFAMPVILNAGLSSSGGKVLDIDIGAKAMGIGGSYTAGVYDSTAMYWNPAGLSSLKLTEVSLMHLEWIEETRYEHIYFAIPILKGTLGASVSFMFNSFEQIVNYEPVGNPYFNYDLIISIGYSRPIYKGFSVGGVFKYLNSSIVNNRGYGIGFDIGLMYKLTFPSFIEKIKDNASIGLTFQNIGFGIKYNDERDALPFKICFGIQYKFIKYCNIFINFKRVIDNSFNFNVGLEIMPDWYFTPRIGYKAGNEMTSLTMGAGVYFKFKGFKIRIDYATNPLAEIGLNHWVMLTINPAKQKVVEKVVVEEKIIEVEKEQKKLVAVVLNYENTSGTPNLNYLSRTIPETIAATFGRSEKILVIEKKKVWEIIKEMGYDPENILPMDKLIELGKKLKVNAVVSGSFVSVGDVLRITSRIVDIETGGVIVSDLAQGEIGPMMFEVMDDIALKLQQHLERIHSEKETEEKEE